MDFLTEGGPNAVIDWNQASVFVDQFLNQLKQHRQLTKVLLVPPDKTRPESGGNELTTLLYEKLAPIAEVDVLPALGTHHMMDDATLAKMFPSVPRSQIHEHRWQTEVETVGEIPASVMHRLTNGLFQEPLAVAVNRRLIHGGYDAIISVGQLVPHEVAGIANHAKNIVIGVGGAELLNKSHYLSAVHGMERIMGRAENPVRALFDCAAEKLHHLPLVYLLTVRSDQAGSGVVTRGLFAGDDRGCYERGATLCQQVNVIRLDRAPKKIVVRVSGVYESTWLANKAIYRTRMAIADGGELIVIAPNVREFGEQTDIDEFIRKYGYRGTPATTKAVDSDIELQKRLSVPAHLIHGSTEGRFTVAYAPGYLSRDEIERVGFSFADYKETAQRFPATMKPGWNSGAGEDIYYIPDPGLNLWTTIDRWNGTE